MTLRGRVFPCSRCFKTTHAVIDMAEFDRAETPALVGIRVPLEDEAAGEEHDDEGNATGTMIVCAGCLRSDYASKVSPAKKIISSPAAKAAISPALRSDGDDDDEDDEDETPPKPIKPLPKPMGSIFGAKRADPHAGKTISGAAPVKKLKKKKKLKKRHSGSDE